MSKRKVQSIYPTTTKRYKDQTAERDAKDAQIDILEDQTVGISKFTDEKDDKSAVVYPGLSEYEVLRLKNIEQHAMLFESLQLGDARNALATVRNQKKQVTLKTKEKSAELQPSRVSLRLRLKNSSDIVGKEFGSLVRWEPANDQPIRQRIPSGPVLLSTVYNGDADASKELAQSLRTYQSKVVHEDGHVMGDLKRYGQFLQTLKLSEKRVAKVVPDRIMALAVHPSPALPIVAVGDKWGRLGIWQVFSRDGEDGVYLFEPHSQPLSCLKYATSKSHLLFSTSYDGTVRCMDVQREIFDEVFSLPASQEVKLNSLSFTSTSFDSFIIACSDGKVRIVDVRASKCHCAEVALHMRNVKCVDVHPLVRDYFVSCSADSVVAVWDLRCLRSHHPVVKMNHHKQVDSAYFSPLTGNKIVSSSTDNTVKISSFEDGNLHLTKSIPHDNQTGRWLTNFKPMWDPKRDDVFVIGSMKRPRQVEVWGSNGNILASLHHELFNSVSSLNSFHPSENWIVGGNSSGRVFVWM
ncbi:WD repeat-containing protein 76-like [Corticium candelabrum]|uniref:WD repeat-containing protein 76-like n=1 Tax=Corticium candelabrum TaxID=121492 RepID=UPI002E273C94|nr:WD repeat-containing protein 76-like [Corticium candelabrum]